MGQEINKNFYRSYIFHGRLGNICYQLCHLVRYIEKKNDKLEKLVLDPNYLDFSYYHTTSQYVIRDNLPFFKYFSNNLRDDFDSIKNKLIYWAAYYKPLVIEPEYVYKIFYNRELYSPIIEKYPDISKYVSIHIRRTDFFNYCPKVIIKKDTVKKIIDKHPKVMIFSDDMDYCEKNFTNSNVSLIHNKEEYNDIIMMSLTSKIYDTNKSTFSGFAIKLKDAIKQSQSKLNKQ